MDRKRGGSTHEYHNADRIDTILYRNDRTGRKNARYNGIKVITMATPSYYFQSASNALESGSELTDTDRLVRKTFDRSHNAPVRTVELAKHICRPWKQVLATLHAMRDEGLIVLTDNGWVQVEAAKEVA